MTGYLARLTDPFRWQLSLPNGTVLYEGPSATVLSRVARAAGISIVRDERSQ